MRTLCFLLIACAASAQTKTLSVCEALDSGVDGQEVVLRGVIAGESHHGFGLSEGIDGDPCPGWRRRFLTTPSFILFDYFSHLGVHLTKEQEQLNLYFLRRLSFLLSPNTSRSGVKIKGVLVRKPWPLIFRRQDGTYWGNGFGQDGWCPTVLVITSIPTGL
jgi:hypothetical protein